MENKTIELTAKQKTGLAERSKAVDAAQAVVQSYFSGIVDSLNLPDGYQWDQTKMVFFKPEKPQEKKNETAGKL